MNIKTGEGMYSGTDSQGRLIPTDYLQRAIISHYVTQGIPFTPPAWWGANPYRAFATDSAPRSSGSGSPRHRRVLDKIRDLRRILARRFRSADDDPDEERGEEFGHGVAKGAAEAIGGPLGGLLVSDDDPITGLIKTGAGLVKGAGEATYGLLNAADDEMIEPVGPPPATDGESETTLQRLDDWERVLEHIRRDLISGALSPARRALLQAKLNKLEEEYRLKFGEDPPQEVEKPSSSDIARARQVDTPDYASNALNRALSNRRLAADLDAISPKVARDEETPQERSERHRTIQDVIKRMLERLRECRDPLECQRTRKALARLVKACSERGDLAPIRELEDAYGISLAADSLAGDSELNASLTIARGEAELGGAQPDYSALQRHADQQRLHPGVAPGAPEIKSDPGYGRTSYQSGITPHSPEPSPEREFRVTREQVFSTSEPDFSALQRAADERRKRGYAQ